jgi:plastocyanin
VKARVLLAAGVLVAVSTASAAAAPPQPARLQVSADEFRLVLSRSRVPAGPAIVGLVNFGEDDHDLALRRRAPGARTWKVRTVKPGEFRERQLRLATGRYLFWCTIADHRALGMRATLRVRPPQRAR